MYLVLALLAAVLFAASTIYKHRSAQAVGPAVIATLRHPAWLIGIALDGGGLAAQVLALHLGPLDVVQPLLTASLVLALVAERKRLPRAAMVWSLVLLAALAGVVALARPASSATVLPADRGPAVIAVSAVVCVVAGCLLIARRRRRGATRAVTLGVGVGVSYAASAALLKVLGDHAVRTGLLDLLESWQLYAVLVCGVVGLALNQLAFAAGSLRQALPTIATVDPLASVALGVLVYDERFRGGTGSGVLDALLLVLVVVAVVQVSRTRHEHRSAVA